MTQHREPKRSSVVIPAFQAAATLGETLASVLSRLGPEDEVLVCDDGSTDITLDVARTTGDGRVRVLEGSHTGTPSAPRNRGIAAASGDLVFFVDADDVALGDKFTKSRAALEAHPDAAMLFTDYRRIDEAGRTIRERALADYEISRGRPYGGVHRLESTAALRLLARENFVGTSSVAVRRDVLRTIGGFDETLPNSEDRDLWYRALRHHPAVFLAETLHAHRQHDHGITSRSLRVTAPARLTVLRRQLDAALDERHARDLRRSMGSIHESLAYVAFDHEDMRTCRDELGEAWKIRPSATIMRRYLLSHVPVRLLRRLRRTR